MTASNGTPRFEQDIKPLFRDEDVRSMDFLLDLWDYQDVSDHAEAILNQVESGRMPCDDRWPQEKVALFRRWIDAGMPA